MGFGDGGTRGWLSEAVGARHLHTAVKLLCASWLGRLCSQVPKGAAGREVSGECGPHCSVQLLWRPKPSWSLSEAWQVEQTAEFFLPLTSKLEHADREHCDL